MLEEIAHNILTKNSYVKESADVAGACIYMYSTSIFDKIMVE